MPQQDQVTQLLDDRERVAEPRGREPLKKSVELLIDIHLWMILSEEGRLTCQQTAFVVVRASRDEARALGVVECAEYVSLGRRDRDFASLMPLLAVTTACRTKSHVPEPT